MECFMLSGGRVLSQPGYRLVAASGSETLQFIQPKWELIFVTTEASVAYSLCAYGG